MNDDRLSGWRFGAVWVGMCAFGALIDYGVWQLVRSFL